MVNPRKLSDLSAASLQEYKKETGIALSEHPLSVRLRGSDSAESVTAILRSQISGSTRRETDRITKSLRSVVSILYTLSVSVDLKWKPTYAGFAILLSTVKDIKATDLLVDLLESIESILKHVDICTKVPHTAAMTEILVKTLLELLPVLGVATKFVKQRQPRTSVKKILGGNFDQMVLERLNRLTLDEGRRTALQILNVVYGFVQNIRVVVDGGKASIDGIWDALKAMHNIVSNVKPKRNKMKLDIRSWLSSPDPLINHKVACELRHTGTTAWFIKGDTFSEWKWSKKNSLLWIHGKAGTGKTTLCSAIIQDIDTMREAGLVSLAFYYFDFRDYRKKDLRGLVSSLIIQLCGQSDSYCDMVSKFYSKHAKGSGRPSDAELLVCLKSILNLPGQAPIYLILDALNECPITSDMPPAREKVLMLLGQLTTSRYPNLRICVTSRLDPDLRIVLEPLSFRSISLHDENGQEEDIASYIKSVVHTDPKMQAWGASDKELVIKVLTRKVDRTFQWASCQLAYLRHCSRIQIQPTLDDLPETLDETYRRILRGIDKAGRALAHRLFGYVSVARRPHRAEELAKLLALSFKGGPLRLFRRGWRQEDLLNAVHTTFSSLLVIAKDGNTTTIQFSHFSVQEFFENANLANASADVSYFHVPMAATHTLIAQACLDVLLRLDKNVTRDSLSDKFLAKYAAEHWLNHVRSGNLSDVVQDMMGQLFDPRNRHLAVCLWIHDAEGPSWMQTERSERPSPLTGTTLHYAAFWGLHTIVKSLVIERSQDVQALGFTKKVTPLHLAVKGGHVEVARFLLERGANVMAQDADMETPLHIVSREGPLESARFLIDHGAHVHALDAENFTPLHLASRGGQLEVTRFLIHHGTDVHLRTGDMNKLAPLHLALREGHLEVARYLINRGANVDSRDGYDLTPLHFASQEGQLAVVRFLIDHRADVNARDWKRSTPLYLASRNGLLKTSRFLIGHGADVNAQGEYNFTPLHLASRQGDLEVVRLLIYHGADVNARDINRLTPLHQAFRMDQLKVARFLADHGADVNAKDMDGFTPLHLASQGGQLEVARILIGHNADMHAPDMDGLMPLHWALQKGRLEVARFLIDHGADVNAPDMDGHMPLHMASRKGQLEVVRFLIDHGADVDGWDIDRSTPLHLASRVGQLKVAHLLIHLGADVNAQNMWRSTPLHVASREGRLEAARILLEQGADSEARDNDNCTPLHWTSQLGYLEVSRVLLEHGADVNSGDVSNWTPLHGASQDGHSKMVHFLLSRGANVDASDLGGWTSLQLTSRNGDLGTVLVLLEHGANTGIRDNNNWTPLHCASRWGHRNVVQALLKHGADANARDNNNWTPLHYASQWAHPEVVPVLIRHHVDVNSRGDGNQTPLHLASQAGYQGIVQLLVWGGADIYVRNDEGRTPFEEASVKGHRNVMQLLLQHGARNKGV